MPIIDEYECKHYEIIVAEVACADLVGGGLAEELLLLMEVVDEGRTGGLDQVGGSGTSG